jgi:hypothetical protein
VSVADRAGGGATFMIGFPALLGNVKRARRELVPAK